MPDTTAGADWLLERVRVKEKTSGVVTEFEHGGWLSENATSVFLQARNCAPSFPYEIAVVTGSDVGAGTDSRVYCTLFGNICAGSSGEFHLINSAEHSDAFETGSTDTFQHILSRSLGRISSICIRHDASGLGSDWQLQRVTVKDVTSGEVTEFEHGGWLTKERCSVVLSAHRQSIQSAAGFLYEVSVDTGSDPGSGTDSKVYVVLYGEDGQSSGELALTRSILHSDPFETGKTDTFRHVLRNSLGRVHFVRVRHDATGVGSDWKLDRVRVRDISSGLTIEFDHGDWLTNSTKEVLLPSCHGKPTFPYEITVATGKDQGAGTDSKVFCTLHGESWSCSDALALASSLSNSDPFETGKSDTFRHLFPRPLGRINSISIRFDATGFGADWLLDRVSVRDVTDGHTSEFIYGDWLTRDKQEVVLTALPQLSVAEPLDDAAAYEVRLPPTLSLPGSIPESSCEVAEEQKEQEESAEVLTRSDAFAGEKSVAAAEAIASDRKGRMKRAAKLLLRLGISRKSADTGEVDAK
jgi:hypothetical protein